MKKFGQVLLATIVATTSTGYAENTKKRKPASTARPPQFVFLAFDGSKDNNFWQESYDFAKSVSTKNLKNEKTNIKFTYFVNPTYYLGQANRSNYVTPGVNKPLSCIGWASDDGTAKSVPLRIKNTNQAFRAGHEIGSHANSHCDASGKDKDNPMYGRPWGEKEWTSEFTQFNKLLFGAFKINGIKPIDTEPNGFAFTEKDIKGFRAPLLETTEGLWPTLKKFGYSYDTSLVNATDYWPVKKSWGGWDIPLARIKIAGTSKTVIGMDYNWLCYHSACASKPNLTDTDRRRFEKQVVDSYLYYFKKNYFGNRAPVQIGHHFSKWNQGAYWNAMKEFSKQVCGRPEVHCVTFAEYVSWLNGLSPELYKDYRSGNFPRLQDDRTISDIATVATAEVRLDQLADGYEAVVADQDKMQVERSGWKAQLLLNFQALPTTAVTREQLEAKFNQGDSFTVRAAIINTRGHEVSWQTYRVEKFKTQEEKTVGPLEDLALQGESAEAHRMHE